MLQITTQQNYLQNDPEKNQYCFRSRTSRDFTGEELIQEMIRYNSTITEADARAVIAVLGTLVPRYVAEGYDVELPFGTFHLTAKGSCAKLSSVFEQGTGDNNLGVVFVIDKAVKAGIIAAARYGQLDSDYRGDPVIKSLAVVKDDTTESDELTLKRGKMLRIHGKNLAFDLADPKQGVFLGTGENAPRVGRYTRAGTNVIDIVIPENTVAGAYKIMLTTKPGVRRYRSDSLDLNVTVTE